MLNKEKNRRGPSVVEEFQPIPGNVNNNRKEFTDEAKQMAV